MSHGIDLVHFFMNEQPPRSIMAHGGVFAWHDGRENPDTFQALVEYPGFLVSYSTSFGNDSDSFSRIMGKKATLVNIGGEGSPRWKVVEEKGNHEDNPDDRARRTLGHAAGRRQAGPDQHRRRGPVAHRRTGSSACAAATRGRTRPSTTASCTPWPCIMAAQSYWQGKRLYYDAKAESISDTAPQT